MSTDMAITQEAWGAAAARVEIKHAQSEDHYLDVQRTRALNGQPHVEHLPSCPADCMTTTTKPPYVAPADSAINVRDCPSTTIVRTWGRQGSYYHIAPGAGVTFAYQTVDRSQVYLAAPEAHGGRWTALWVSHCGGSKYAEDITAKDAIRCALWPLAQIDRALASAVMAALLSRKTEYVWRGEVTPERIDADFDAAITLNGGE